MFETRGRILKDICRILKPDGKITLKYEFCRNYPALPIWPIQEVSPDVATKEFKIDQHHAHWFDNKPNAQGTNGAFEVVVDTANLRDDHVYFSKYFETVDFWFYDVSIGRGGWGSRGFSPGPSQQSYLG